MSNLTYRDLLSLFLRNIIIIIISAIVCGTAAFVYCENFTDENYRASGSILSTNGGIGTNANSSAVQNTDIAASVNLLNTIKDLLNNSPKIYKELAKKTGNKYTYVQLMNAATVESQNDTSLILNVSFVLNSRNEAIEVTNMFLELCPEFIAENIAGTEVKITAESYSAVKTAPKTASTTILAALIGTVLCYAIIVFVTSVNVTIKSEEDFSMHYKIPVIGNIPDFSITNNSSSNKQTNKAKSKARR